MFFFFEQFAQKDLLKRGRDAGNTNENAKAIEGYQGDHLMLPKTKSISMDPPG